MEIRTEAQLCLSVSSKAQLNKTLTKVTQLAGGYKEIT